ncbi:MAG TPA: M15 family metallopeptidase [Acidimicrobiales bacterium]|nr:M15 family metallopeptidase [Acidimicrobiales bacterium]
MDRVGAIESRIAAIESRFGAPAARAAPSGSGDAFAAALGAAERTAATAPTAQTVAPFAAAPVGAAWSPAMATDPRSLPNGAMPPWALESIGVGDHQLAAGAARAWRSLMDAAARDGVDIGIISSYRTLAQQEHLVRTKGLYSQGGLAAAPGTSNHGWGLAVDVDVDDTGQAWLRANAGRFGFAEDVPREPWHWTYQG